MEESKKVTISVVVFFAIVAIGIAVYFIFFQGKTKEEPAVLDVPQVSVPVEEPPEEVEETFDVIEVELDKSDELIRQLAAGFSSHPSFARWLLTKDIIRKFVAAVDNIAEGQSPSPHIHFFEPRESFRISEKEGVLTVDARSYQRYNVVGAVFDSLDTAGSSRLYRQLKPSIQEAYSELGYPEKNFDRTFASAISVLLKVPVVKNIALERKVVTYMMVDPKLEKLNPAQKHLLRMGPENVRRIKNKLREIAEALGLEIAGLP
jgi:hypothetical protein